MTTSRRKTEEKENGGRLPLQPGQRRGIQGEGATPTREKVGQPREPAQAEAYSVSLRQRNHTKMKSKPNQRRESHVTVVDRGRTPTEPEIGDPTGRVGTPPDPGVQRHSSTRRASQQVPDKEPCQHPPQRSYGGRTTKDKPQPPQASSQPGSEREEPKEGSRK